MEATDRGACKDVTGFSPYEKRGQGQYSRDNLMSHSAADIAATYVVKALENLHYDPTCGRPFTICEYGAADGLTSVCVMNQIIEFVRGKYGKEVPITIIYEDRPAADFNSLFRALSGELQEPFANYPAFNQNVFVFATGRSFFEQCLPNDSLDFAYSALSLQYLNERPCQLQDVINVVESRDHQERSLFAAQAAKDWSRILLQRAKELVPGGQMFLCVAAIDELGQYCGKTRRVPGVSLFEFLAQPWREMIQEGRISQEEFADMSLNSYWRTVDEFAAPFRDQTSAVYRAGLRLVSLETKIILCPMQTERLKEENKVPETTSSRQEFAKRAVIEVRRWTNWLFIQALKKTRQHEESVTIVEEFWKRFEHLAAINSEKLHADNALAYICIEKVAHE